MLKETCKRDLGGAVCCSVVQCGAMLQCVQCVAVHYSVLQCLAVCCSVLQCVAVCCNTLHLSGAAGVCS